MNCFWNQHEFTVYQADQTHWNDVPGIYIFSANVGGQWKAMYVGQASSLKERLGNHERWGEARLRSVRHIHAKVIPSQLERDRIEEELIKALQPPMNTMLKGRASLRSLAGVMPIQTVPAPSQHIAQRGVFGGLSDPTPSFLNALGVGGLSGVNSLHTPPPPPTGMLKMALFGLPPRK